MVSATATPTTTTTDMIYYIWIIMERLHPSNTHRTMEKPIIIMQIINNCIDMVVVAARVCCRSLSIEHVRRATRNAQCTHRRRPLFIIIIKVHIFIENMNIRFVLLLLLLLCLHMFDSEFFPDIFRCSPFTSLNDSVALAHHQTPSSSSSSS